MTKRAKQVNTKFNTKSNKYDKLSIKAPKGQRRAGVDQDGKIIIYDDKGIIVAIKE